VFDRGPFYDVFTFKVKDTGKQEGAVLRLERNAASIKVTTEKIHEIMTKPMFDKMDEPTHFLKTAKDILVFYCDWGCSGEVEVGQNFEIQLTEGGNKNRGPFELDKSKLKNVVLVEEKKIKPCEGCVDVGETKSFVFKAIEPGSEIINFIEPDRGYSKASATITITSKKVTIDNYKKSQKDDL
jgi:hypothetical protein